MTSATLARKSQFSQASVLDTHTTVSKLSQAECCSWMRLLAFSTALLNLKPLPKASCHTRWPRATPWVLSMKASSYLHIDKHDNTTTSATALRTKITEAPGNYSPLRKSIDSLSQVDSHLTTHRYNLLSTLSHIQNHSTFVGKTRRQMADVAPLQHGLWHNRTHQMLVLLVLPKR